MNDITYEMIEETYSFEGNVRCSYGIAAYANADTDGTATIVASVHDITADRQALAELVSLCNRLEISLLHLDNIIEDFLAS